MGRKPIYTDIYHKLSAIERMKCYDSGKASFKYLQKKLKINDTELNDKFGDLNELENLNNATLYLKDKNNEIKKKIRIENLKNKLKDITDNENENKED